MKKEYFSKMDMHIHSIASDGVDNYRTILKVAKKKNLGISIADHNHISQSVQAAKNKMGITAVPAIEATCKEGAHLLFYFYSSSDLKYFFNKYIKPYHNKVSMINLRIGAFDLIEAANNLNGIMIAPHPFSLGSTGTYSNFKNDSYFIKNLLAIEGINSANLNYMNEKSIKWAKAINKPITAGSDSHKAAFIGTAVTLVDSNDSVDDVLDSIKARKFGIHGRSFNALERFIDIMIKTKLFLSHPSLLYPYFI